ncbi:hypothetical protein DP114_25500 [Brasilonema sennae CENA114]|uniref:Uncharacterized protein n=1 Tax=Brasilonema sennae CENA114 TaxID=415709 RepID=A0A856ML22_9CYAN|nr:hypothetical protein DP114_25500 [Brasilonema sennae CENA114]
MGETTAGATTGRHVMFLPFPPKAALGTPRSRHNGQSSPLGLLPPADFGGTPTPFGFASRLGRETLSVCVAPPMPAARLRLSGLVATTRLTRARHNSWQRWSHQIPLSGNTHQVLAPSGFTSRLRRETRLQRWIHRKAQLLAGLAPSGNARRLRR